MTMDMWLTVWEEGGEYYTVDVNDEPRIDAAVSAYLDSGESRDSVLTLDLTDGRTYRVRASQIVSWAVSTPETRRRSLELRQWQDEEEAQMKQELGIWEES